MGWNIFLIDCSREKAFTARRDKKHGGKTAWCHGAQAAEEPPHHVQRCLEAIRHECNNHIHSRFIYKYTYFYFRF